MDSPDDEIARGPLNLPMQIPQPLCAIGSSLYILVLPEVYRDPEATEGARGSSSVHRIV